MTQLCVLGAREGVVLAADGLVCHVDAQTGETVGHSHRQKWHVVSDRPPLASAVTPTADFQAAGGEALDLRILLRSLLLERRPAELTDADVDWIGERWTRAACTFLARHPEAWHIWQRGHFLHERSASAVATVVQVTARGSALAMIRLEKGTTCPAVTSKVMCQPFPLGAGFRLALGMATDLATLHRRLDPLPRPISAAAAAAAARDWLAELAELFPGQVGGPTQVLLLTTTGAEAI